MHVYCKVMVVVVLVDSVEPNILISNLFRRSDLLIIAFVYRSDTLFVHINSISYFLLLTYLSYLLTTFSKDLKLS